MDCPCFGLFIMTKKCDAAPPVVASASISPKLPTVRTSNPKSSRVPAERQWFYADVSIFPDCELLHTSFLDHYSILLVWTDKLPIWEMSTRGKSRSFAVNYYSIGE